MPPNETISESEDVEQNRIVPEKEQFLEESNSSEQDTGPPKYTEGNNAYWRQYSYALSAHLGAFIMAAVWSWSSTALPSLRNSITSIGVLTTRDEAWIAAVTFLGGVFGAPAMGQLAQKFGLRLQLIVATVLVGIFWIVIGAAYNVPMIIAGRFLTGFFISGVGVSTMLVSEYCDKGRRGRLNYGFDLMFCAGVLFIYILGTFVSWRVQAYASASICALFLIFLIFLIDESPRVLIKDGKVLDARKAFEFLKDIDEDMATELVNQTRREINATETDDTTGGNFLSSWKEHLTIDTMKPILICTALQFFLQLCGVVPIVCYAVDVFKAAGSEQIHENVSTIVLGAINLLATLAAFFLVDKAGRRKLFMLSEASLCVTLGIIGIFLYFKDELKYEVLEKYSWFTLACLVIFITMYSFGVGPIPWVVIGETVAPNSKGFSNGIINLAARVFGFLLMFYFPTLNIALGQHGVYWLFSFICFLGLLYSMFFLPETKNLSLEYVQTLMKGRWVFFPRGGR